MCRDPDECVHGSASVSMPDGRSTFECHLKAWEAALPRADTIIEALTAAGYTIIRDDENHKATVERCIAECDRIDNECGMEAGLAAACSDALRSLIKEDGE